MESKQIIDILSQFSATNTYKKVFINGAWGIGKSYYTNEYIKQNSSNIVYISLFGKNSFEMIENSIAKELMNKLNKVDKFKTKAEDFVKKLEGSISFNGFSLSTPNYNSKTLIEKFSTLLEEQDLIIIFDDLERKSANVLMEDIMGMIEELSLFEKMKIVVIGDENNINEEDLNKWNKFKEKLIEKEYKIITFSYEAIESLVITRLDKYIGKKTLEDFVSNFLLSHKTSNLRTINKGINLFMEIVNNYLYEEYNEDVYLCIAKNCMAVAIEYTEELYKPNEEDKNSKDSTKSWMYTIDSDISSRIVSHYFRAMFMNNKDSSIVDYVIKIYLSEITKSLIDDFNIVLKNYISIKEEKNIFYLSQENITKKIKKLYDDIRKDKYVFSSVEEFIDDIYNLVTWNKEFKLKLNDEIILKKFNSIMLLNYYDSSKELYENKIDRFDLKQRESSELKELIDIYNNEVEKKYLTDKINYIADKYKKKDFDRKYLEWLKWRFIQEDKEKTIKFFIEKARENNYFIPDLSIEINEQEWSWTHYIWYLFFEYLNEDYKKELNDYAESIKDINLISRYRINGLQEYRPLIQKNKEE